METSICLKKIIDRTKPVHQLFEGQAKIANNKKAIFFNQTCISYRQLNIKANQIAHALISSGLQKEFIVGIFLERSIYSIISMLGVLKAGGAFLIIDKSQPNERINFILKNSKVRFLIVDSESKNFIDKNIDVNNYILFNVRSVLKNNKDKVENPNLNISHQNLAYAIYTSGTTGFPKGVLIEHRGLTNTILSQIEILKIKRKDRILCSASFLFDASLWEIWGALLSGGKVFLTTESQRLSIKMLAEFIQKSRITIATLTPSVLRLLPQSCLQSIRILISAGEVCTPDLLDKTNDKCLFYNAYGPTETSICATIGRMDRRTKDIHLGKPIKNIILYVLKDDLNPALLGEVGTLYISGVGLARGYLNNNALTNSRFIKNPRDPNSNLYNTGDLVYLDWNGNLKYIGRKDDEIKIRGNRVNLNEIRNLLMQHPNIKNTIIKSIILLNKNKIIAYVETDDDELNFREIRDFLKPYLPKYMLPSQLIKKRRLPLSTNGKLGHI